MKLSEILLADGTRLDDHQGSLWYVGPDLRVFSGELQSLSVVNRGWSIGLRNSAQSVFFYSPDQLFGSELEALRQVSRRA